MSYRSLLEFNHDFITGDESEGVAFAYAFNLFAKSCNPDLLPHGVQYLGTRHHTDPDPLTEWLRLLDENKHLKAESLRLKAESLRLTEENMRLYRLLETCKYELARTNKLNHENFLLGYGRRD